MRAAQRLSRRGTEREKAAQGCAYLGTEHVHNIVGFFCGVDCSKQVQQLRHGAVPRYQAKLFPKLQHLVKAQPISTPTLAIHRARQHTQTKQLATVQCARCTPETRRGRGANTHNPNPRPS